MASRRKTANNDRVRTEEIPVTPETTSTGVDLWLTSSAAIRIHTGNSQNQGARPYQEDSFGYSNIIDSEIVSNKGLMAILSDGMGGLANGKNVADYVVQTSISMFDSINPRANIKEQLTSIARYINREMCGQYTSSNGKSTAGATMVLAYIFKNRIYWVTTGDSRLYCFRNGNLIQMNEDHDYKNQLLRDYIDDGGDLEDIENEPQKDSLVSFIGKKNLPSIDASVRGYMIKPNDTFVLCSDGIYNGISQSVIKDILSNCDAQEASERIVQCVVNARHRGQDNMTVMVIQCKNAV